MMFQDGRAMKNIGHNLEQRLLMLCSEMSLNKLSVSILWIMEFIFNKAYAKNACTEQKKSTQNQGVFTDSVSKWRVDLEHPSFKLQEVMIPN